MVVDAVVYDACLDIINLACRDGFRRTKGRHLDSLIIYKSFLRLKTLGCFSPELGFCGHGCLSWAWMLQLQWGTITSLDIHAMKNDIKHTRLAGYY